MADSPEGNRHSMIDLFPEALQSVRRVAKGIVAYIPHALEFRNVKQEKKTKQYKR